MSFTGNPRGARLLVAGLIVASLAIAAVRSCHADEAKPTFFAAGGQMFMSTTSIASGLRLGMEQGPWQASIVTHGEGLIQEPEAGYIFEPNIGACGTWHLALRRLSIGWGACLWEHGDFSVGDRGPRIWKTDVNAFALDDDGIQLTAAIVLRRTFGAREHAFVEVFHASSGGSTWYNRGRNLVALGARF